MSRALELARQGLNTTTPNPRVGCVLVKNGVIVGEGWHRRAGEAHAEVGALAQAGEHAQGATAYVTLEPCSHFGRTPPCVDALVRAQVARVVAAMEDPNPSVNGRGLARLREAGVDVRCGLLRDEAIELNIGFVSRMTRGRPWVRLKLATSLDGLSALPDGTSQWITSQPARTDGHAWRARACAVLTGIGTVQADNPRLDVRGLNAPRQPHLVVVDSRLDIPLDARLFSTLGLGDQARQIWIYTATPGNEEKRQALEALGATVIDMPGPGGKVDLAALLRDLGQREINELHVEAGHKLNGSWIREGLVDEFLLYLAPQMLGPGQGMANLPALTDLNAALQLSFHSVDRVGPDLRLLLRHANASTRPA